MVREHDYVRFFGVKTSSIMVRSPFPVTYESSSQKTSLWATSRRQPRDPGPVTPNSHSGIAELDKKDLLWTPAQRKRASMLYFANVFYLFIYFYGRLILRPW